MRLAHVLYCLMAALPAGQAVAQTMGAGGSAGSKPKAVLELFTSQSCSSCPPADALFKSYAERKDLVALTFNVDYWDYLGWKDTLAAPKNGERQRAYSKARGDGMVYTPQIVINGGAHVKGSDRQAIDKAIEKSAREFGDAQIPVRMREEKGQLVIEAGEDRSGAASNATIWLAIVQKHGEVTIRQGENSGKKLAYSNVVREMTSVGMWNGRSATIRLDRQSIMRPDTEACAVLIQKGQGGPIIGAAWMGAW